MTSSDWHFPLPCHASARSLQVGSHWIFQHSTKIGWLVPQFNWDPNSSSTWPSSKTPLTASVSPLLLCSEPLQKLKEKGSWPETMTGDGSWHFAGLIWWHDSTCRSRAGLSWPPQLQHWLPQRLCLFDSSSIYILFTTLFLICSSTYKQRIEQTVWD